MSSSIYRTISDTNTAVNRSVLRGGVNFFFVFSVSFHILRACYQILLPLWYWTLGGRDTVTTIIDQHQQPQRHIHVDMMQSQLNGHKWLRALSLQCVSLQVTKFLLLRQPTPQHHHLSLTVDASTTAVNSLSILRLFVNLIKGDYMLTYLNLRAKVVLGFIWNTNIVITKYV